MSSRRRRRAGGGGAPGAPSSGGPLGSINSIFSSLGGLFKGGMGGVSSIFKSVGGIFSGFMAEGGDVTPGHQYIVGENGAERFVPRVAGHIVPAGQRSQILNYSPTYHINTPNADTFRRTQAQLLTEGYRTMVMTHARHS